MVTFILDSDAGFAGQTIQCCKNIDDYTTILGLNAPKVAKFKISNEFVQFVFKEQTEVQAFAYGFTLYKDQLHNGPSKLLMETIPITPVFPTTDDVDEFIIGATKPGKSSNPSDFLLQIFTLSK